MNAGPKAPEGTAPTGASSRSRPAIEGVAIETLKRRADFVAARNGAKAHGKSFVLQLRRRGEGEDAGRVVRIGYTVTKKVGNAVVRNRIKRRLRAAVATANWPAEAAGCDVVIVARIEAMNVPFDGLVAAIEQGLAQALRRGQSVKTENGRRQPGVFAGRAPDPASGGVANSCPAGQKPA